MKKILFIFYFVSLLRLEAQVYSLEECVKIALMNKESLKSAELDVLSASAGAKGSFSNILPSVSYSNSWNETNVPSSSTTSSFDFMDSTYTMSSSFGGVSNTYGMSFSVSQPLYDGGRWGNQIKSANNSLLISQQLERTQKINVILNVHRSFFQMLKSEQLLDVAKKTLDLARQQVNLVNTQYELGAVKKSDLLKAQVQFGRAQSDILLKETSLYNAKLNLKNSMGLVGSDTHVEIEDIGRPLLPLPEIESSIEEMEENNPTLRVYRSNISGAELNRKILFGSRLPNISASYSYGSSTNEFEEMTKVSDWSSSLSLSLSVPLFTGYSLSTRQQQAELNVRKQQYDYLTQKHDLQVQLENLIHTLKNYSDLIPISEQVLTSAEEDLKLVQQRYSLGSATILEVLDAQVSVTQARSSLVSTKYDARIQEAQLRAFMGTLDQDHN